jgi:aminocarboxymuconate-semialdehyde decarboxylase
MGQPSQRDPVVDVHAHAMPMPLLRWLADLDLADVSGAADEVIRLDSRVSGVGDRVPLPLARSQHDAGVRLAEMDDVGVSHHAVSMPPFLFCSTADDGGLVRDVVARGNTELAAYVASGQGRLVALGSVPLGWPGAAAQALPGRAGYGGNRDRQPRCRA